MSGMGQFKEDGIAATILAFLPFILALAAIPIIVLVGVVSRVFGG
jgi:hypothetical protein